MSEKTNKYLRLTKAGAITLVCTLIVSLFFIIFGIVKLNDNGNDKTYRVYEDSSKHLSIDSDEYYELKFEPNHSGRYTINLDGAYICEIKDEYGDTVSYRSQNYSAYDYSYSVSLNESETYTIRIYADSSSVLFYAYYN